MNELLLECGIHWVRGNRRQPHGSFLTPRWRGVDSNFQFRARWATVSKLCPRPARSAIGAGVSSEQLLASPNTPTKRSWTDSGVPALSSRPLVDSHRVTVLRAPLPQSRLL